MGSILSTSDQRRDTVIASAISAFARTGYLGTPTAKIAEHAKISTAYVFKLFPSKEALFVVALERCFELIVHTLNAGAEAALDQSPDGVLDAMGGAYAELIADRELLMMQVHAQSACDVPEVRRALREGLGQVTRFASSRSGASDEAVQRFIAYGQLCHTIVTAELDAVEADWAHALTAGIRHPGRKETRTA
ncbi:TetR family transcriptional regulator [Microterricola gilva]|uniref:TetR family transcriptional regulator n=1 Tax=Microterricola gilva TaxID=393267 RepID=A0A4Q8AKZ7_9MICO|nr:TetR/AcrR family transcriptional regulator [Microterricola gilva]RZU65222.1 TetR family transcriptional regulator [Microterricola gilva]